MWASGPGRLRTVLTSSGRRDTSLRAALYPCGPKRRLRTPTARSSGRARSPGARRVRPPRPVAGARRGTRGGGGGRVWGGWGRRVLWQALDGARGVVGAAGFGVDEPAVEDGLFADVAGHGRTLSAMPYD